MTIQFTETSYNLDAEQTVLANLMSMLPCDETRDVIQTLEIDDFFEHKHQLIFKAIRQLSIAKYDYIDTIIVVNYLDKNKELSSVTTDYLLELFEQRKGSVLSLKYHAKIIRDLSLMRKMMSMGDKMLQLTNSFKGSVEEAVAQCSLDMDALSKSIKPELIKARHFRELLDEDFLELEYLLDPVMRITNQIVIHAEAGVGKSLFVGELAWAVSTGGTAFGWTAPKPRCVLIIDGEMSLPELQSRYRELNWRNGGDPAKNFYVMSFADFEEDINLVLPHWQVIVNKKIEEIGAELVIFDNLDSLFSVDQNKQVEWMPAQIWLKRLRSDGVATILVHHSNKQKQSFGTTAVSRNPNLILALNRPDNYSPEDGAHFDVKVDKARELHDVHAATFRCKLTPTGWEVTESPISVKGLKKEILEYLQEAGGSAHFRQIAEDLNKGESNVKGYLSGLIKERLVVAKGKGVYELVPPPEKIRLN
jgi:hypothetical protein